MKKKKLGFVVQRYGLEVNGGSEVLCRTLAEKLSKHYDIEAITTCAIDHATWSNAYPPGLHRVNNIPVHRFPVSLQRDVPLFVQLSNRVFGYQQNTSREDTLEWLRQIGPYSEELIRFIDTHKDAFDGFVFFTYLYATANFGLPLVKDKAFFVPTAHDEPYIKVPIFGEIFRAPKGIIFLSPEEQELVHRLFQNRNIPNVVTGIGVDFPQHPANISAFKKKYGLSKPYILYLGRIEPGKGAGELFEFFMRYKARGRHDIQLVMVGKNLIDIPNHPDIRHLGFVPEEDKLAALAGTEALVNHSAFESFSIVITEAWALGIPVMVNGRCEVMVGQCARSNGGLWYESYEEFHKTLEWLLDNKESARKIGQQGRDYVSGHYNWPAVEQRYISFLDRLI